MPLSLNEPHGCFCNRKLNDSGAVSSFLKITLSQPGRCIAHCMIFVDFLNGDNLMISFWIDWKITFFQFLSAIVHVPAQLSSGTTACIIAWFRSNYLPIYARKLQNKSISDGNNKQCRQQFHPVQLGKLCIRLKFQWKFQWFSWQIRILLIKITAWGPRLGPLYEHGLTLIPTWISNHILSKVWDAISYPIPTLDNGCNYSSMLGLKLILKGATGVK